MSRPRSALRRLHRYLSISLGMFWLLQALTGVLLSFRWELDDAAIAGAPHPIDLPAIEQRIKALEAAHPGWSMSWLWTSGSGSNRYDIALVHISTEKELIWRTDGAGTVLRIADPALPLSCGTIYDTLTKFHTTLLLGDLGNAIVGLSGAILFTNILVGLQMAWPARGRWRQALSIRRLPSQRMQLWQWHRALGLWLAVPAMAVVLSGVLLTQPDAIGGLLGVRAYSTPALPPHVGASAGQNEPVRLQAVVNSARSRFPDADLSGVIYPTPTEPWFTVRLRQKAEPLRKFGKTTVFVEPSTGLVIAARDAVDAPLATRIVNYLYPLHTGQVFSLPGRIVGLLIGLWLTTMIALGSMLFVRRRNDKVISRAAAGSNLSRKE